MAVRVLEPACEWRAGDIADASRWTLHLSPDDVAELEAALGHAKSRTGDLLDVTAADFPLPTLAPVSPKWKPI